MKKSLAVVAGVVLFSVFIAFRAVDLPITHDEASTWLNYRHLNVFSCLSNYACWGSANNHWLNTLLLQWSAGLFGEAPWALRLPNVFAGILYLVAAALLSLRYIKQPVLQVAGFLLLVAHIYLLDFFSLARGYGMMSCGVLWGIYGMLRYVENLDLRWVMVLVTSLFLSVLGNFTALVPWASIGLGWLTWWLLMHREKKIALLVRHSIPWVVSAVVLIVLLRFPIKVLSASGEFEWGSTGPWMMMIDLMTNLLYGRKHFGEHSPEYLLYGIMIAVGIVMTSVMVNRKTETRNQILVLFILLLCNFFILIVQQELTGAKMPVGRKTIFLIPFIFGLLALGLNLIKHKLTGIIVGVVLSFALCYHFSRSSPWSACREWYYDAHYPELLSTVLPKGSASDSLKLGSSWIFNPALVFYQQTQSLPISGLIYQKQIVIDSTMQYYYLDPSDTIGMYLTPFVLDTNFGPFLLYKRVETEAVILK